MKKMNIIFITITILLFFTALWAVFIEPNTLTINRISIKDPALKGLTIVFASDFHIKPYEKYRLKRIIRAINKQNSHIIILGGDYVNGHKKGCTMKIEEIAAQFSQLKSKLGVFAVIGNHDGWQGKEEIINELEKNKVQVLFNSSKCFEKFCIAGVDDLQTGTPDIINLTLAGHLHGGQIRLHQAIITPSAYGKKYANGYLNDNGKKIYTTKGLGTSILPIRFNCLPEIAVITFY